MKCLLIRDLVSTKELSGEDLAAVRGGWKEVIREDPINGSGPVITERVPTTPSEWAEQARAMIDAIYALIPVYAPMNPTPIPGPIMVAPQ